MRKQIVSIVAAGALGLTSLAVTAPAALAAVGADTAAVADTSRVDRIQQALSGLVTDGTITQDQADKVATTLESADLRGGRGGLGGGRNLAAAASALGLTEEELRSALQADGATLAGIATDKGVSVDTLIAALVEAEKTRIAQAVTDGRITQEQADAKLADLRTRITERVNSTGPEKGTRGDRPAPDSTTGSTEGTSSSTGGAIAPAYAA